MYLLQRAGSKALKEEPDNEALTLSVTPSLNQALRVHDWYLMP